MNHTQRPAARRLTQLSAVAAVAMVATTVAVAPAQASGGDRREVSNTSRCASGVIKVKAKADDGRIEVEGEVDTNRRAQAWRWQIRRDGDVAARGTRETAGPSGSFSVERKIANPAGSDRIVFRATHNGQVCRVGVTF
jgi:hypothetical protein